MGASGRVGGAAAQSLADNGAAVRVGLRTPEKWTGPGAAVHFDLADAATYSALSGCAALFLMWPPGTTTAQVGALIEAARSQGVRRVVFLSILGAEKVPVLPHRQMEKLLMASGGEWTFLRASYFMQNLSTTHRDDIRLRDEIFLPAGQGRTSMVDVLDVGEVAALALQGGHAERAYDLTGPAAPNYFEVAQVLSDGLGRSVRYTDPSPLAFVRLGLKRGVPPSFVLFMLAEYTVARLGRAGRVTRTVEELLGRPANDLRAFVQRELVAWR
ncbi:NAD(P)H-binding protein [Deinococcus alpinitundrae]|uniref:NAD(P)H-binding protein n=1 Tax=Deinococcus alpinitundrae TaxID=468913 RepID=UPI0013799CE7|nr:NAD(P)H-binding protein [Deinococcus alpinitundrae]